MSADLVHVGFGNILSLSRVLAIISPNSAPTKRLIQEGRASNLIIDMTNGRRTKGVVVLDTGHLVLTAITPETISGRLQGRGEKG